MSFRIGQVLSTTFWVFARSPLLYAGAGAATFAAETAVTHFLPYQRAYWHSVAVFGLYVLIGTAGKSLVAAGVFQTLRTGARGGLSSISAAFVRSPAVLLCALAVTAGNVVGFVLLFIPALIFEVATTTAVAACVIEKSGPIQSIRRSIELTRGFGWHILGLQAILEAAFLGAWLLTRVIPPRFSIAETVLSDIASIAGITAFAVVSPVIYHQLRVIKEGDDLERAAEVFD